MRTINALKNSIFSLGFQVAILIIGFIVPRQIILVFGSEVNGLSSTITQLLNMINLLQAGMVGAAIYEMFKPIIDNDYKRIASIFYSSVKHFKKLSVVFFLLSLLIIPFLLMSEHTTITALEIIISVIVLGLNGAFIFRCVTCYDIIFSAHQQKYILILGMAIEKTIYYILLFIILFFKLNFLIMYFSILIGSFVKVFYYHKKFLDIYSMHLEKYSSLTKYKVKNQFYLFGNQIIQQLMEGSSVIIISIIYGLVYASVYSIYLLVITMFKTCLITLQNAISASFGDLIASGNIKRTNEIFNFIHFFYIVIGTAFFSTVAVMLLPFISIYTSGLNDINYSASLLALLCVMYLMSYTLFITYDLYINSAGMFKCVFKSNVLVGIIGLLFTLFFSVINYQLALMGTVFFYFFCALIRQLILFNKYSILSPYTFIKRVVFMFSYTLMVYILSIKFEYTTASWFAWITKSLFIFIINSFIVLLYTIILEREIFSKSCLFVKRRIKKNEK